MSINAEWKSVSLYSVMAEQKGFRLGWRDAAHGDPYDDDYDRWDIGHQLQYEQGRQHYFEVVRVTQMPPMLPPAGAQLRHLSSIVGEHSPACRQLHEYSQWRQRQEAKARVRSKARAMRAGKREAAHDDA